MTVSQSLHDAIHRLTPRYGDRESRWMARIIFEHLKGWSQTDLVIRANDELSDFIASKVAATADRVAAGEPLQYVIGEARFYGLTFHVDPSVLIPRPETEGLVDRAVAEAGGRQDLRIMDLCTGSGCIAIALARTLRFATVDALDISPEAILIARDNAGRLNAKVNFLTADILTLPAPAEPLYDLIVSNPPYIARSEAPAMDSHVLLHEPHAALFVDDADPLVFYRAIARYAAAALRRDGALLLEINPRFAADMQQLMRREGFTDVTVTADIHGRQRYLTAKF